ncbi:MAG: TerC family protein [Lapillicoccus sp.]
MDFFSSPDLWIAFLTLFALELVLGIDNVVFISILTGRLPEAQRPRARILGLSLALFMRVGLLLAASWIIGLTSPLFSIGSAEVLEISGRDLILIVGGLFLVYKAVTEIHQKLEGAEEHVGTRSGSVQSTFAKIIVQIVLIDAVFSLDSVITAVGMVDELSIMIAAVVLSIGLMMVLAGRISAFVDQHPTVKMLALTFLVLIGATLLAEGFNVHIDKPLIYGPIAFAIAVEVLNLRYRSRVARRRGTLSEPVHLHSPYAELSSTSVSASGAHSVSLGRPKAKGTTNPPPKARKKAGQAGRL